MTAGMAVLFTVVLLAVLGVWTLVRRYQQTTDMFDTIVDLGPAEDLDPDCRTCLRCGENPALPSRTWCSVCAPIVDEFPAEPIERGAL